MASADKNKKNLEAGRRKLEEFRKKKAQAKNGKSKNQSSTDDATTYEKQRSESEPTPTVISVTDNSHVSSHYDGSESVPYALVDTQSDNFVESDSIQKFPRQGGNSLEIPGLNYQTGSGFTYHTDFSVGNGKSSTELGEGRFASQVSSNDSHSVSYGFDKDSSFSASCPNANVSSNDVTKVYTEGLVTNVSHQEPEPTNSTMIFPASASELDHNHLQLKNHLSYGLEDRNSSNVVGNLSSSRSQRTSESYLTSFNSTLGGSTYSDANNSFIRRSRPTFLDSLNIKDSSVTGLAFGDNDKIVDTKLSSTNVNVSSAIYNPFTGSAPTDPLSIPASSYPSDNFFGNASKGHKPFEQSLERASQKQNEDFAALEQHIEDLTQEKFSLQRSLEASKVLAESLATDNSSLTESYNQQASTVSQLKAEMERLQEEMKARLVELEAIKAEYMNAQLECNAADERAKLLASEVISLEEKALRLRSSELKLERELENSSAEIGSYKKKISALDKERQDLLQTIDALQEEKKLMQSKLRRASASGISMDLNKGHTKKDASTSTNDIGLDTNGDNSDQTSASMELDNVDNSLLLQNILANQEIALSIPPDQVQMIQNINSLITELSSEKEELMQALITEVSTSTKLKELNKELSRKLEVQTQRLELLTAQSMASQLVTTKQTVDSEIQHESVAYADEGDEVVERVLGWIMKLFPGGPSKRRMSRL